jgi:hypothetical protein
MLAPGEPVPGVSCAGAIPSGDARFCACAKANAGANRTAAAMTATAQRRSNVPNPHPVMTTFFETNRGNFKPIPKPPPRPIPMAFCTFSRPPPIGLREAFYGARRLPGKTSLSRTLASILNSFISLFARLSPASRFHHIEACDLLSSSARPIMHPTQGRRAEPYRVGRVIPACKERASGEYDRA